MKEALSTNVATLQRLLSEQSKRNADLLEQNKKLNFLLEKLQQQVEMLLRKLYGKRTEKNQKPGETVEADFVKTVVSQRLISEKPVKPRNTRKFPESLERERIIHVLPEKALGCDTCGRKLNKIGQEITEQLDFKPATLFIKEHVRYKYACRCGGAGVKIAALPPQPIEKGIPGPGLLAEILIAKYQDALPLHRQEQRFMRYGYSLSRSTMCDWVQQCAFLLQPIVEFMKKDLLTAFNIHTDDVPVPVQNKGKTKKGRLWTYLTNGLSSPKCTIYEYTPTRSQHGPQKFLEDYQGYLQADAYPGYDKLYQTKRITEVACFAHARRKFVDVKEAVKADSLADDAIELIGKLYMVEKKAKSFCHIKRYYYRKKYAKPFLRKLNRWLKRQQVRTLSNTPIHQAIAYSIKHWKALQNYLSDGRLAIDNNAAERAIKPVVVGRKNWLFAGSNEGGKRAAIIYSIIETCKQNNVNTFDYLKWVLSKIPIHPHKGIRELLPYHYIPQRA